MFDWLGDLFSGAGDYISDLYEDSWLSELFSSDGGTTGLTAEPSSYPSDTPSLLTSDELSELERWKDQYGVLSSASAPADDKSWWSTFMARKPDDKDPWYAGMGQGLLGPGALIGGVKGIADYFGEEAKQEDLAAAEARREAFTAAEKEKDRQWQTERDAKNAELQKQLIAMRNSGSSSNAGLQAAIAKYQARLAAKSAAIQALRGGGSGNAYTALVQAATNPLLK